MRTSTLGLIAALAVFGWHGDAQACHDQDGNARKTVCFTSIHAGVATAVFMPANIHYASERSWLPPGWAWTEMLLGGVATLAGGGVAIGLAVHDSPDPALDIGWAAGVMALGGIYGSVGIFSLERYLPPPEPLADAGLRLPHLALVPVEGGAMVTAAF
jgi:hypothetical protein